MPEIRQLTASVINKIAAGEVIERPASVVKELVENAIDAGATRIDVTLAGGGSELVRVADDGCGMREDQLALAVASHATSKITSADDLFRVGTLGFRGEALASIGEVSRLLIRSCTRESAAGSELEVIGGEPRGPVPCGCPIGTILEVRDLFYNTPVRRKFLKTPPTETGHATEALTRLALAFPKVHFTLRAQERVVHDLPPTGDLRDRVGAFFGNEVADSLIEVESEDRDVRLSGFVAHPSQTRSTNRLQYLFLNGRHIRDRSLQHALLEGYRGLVMTGRFPICFLRLEMPADLVDVNVHPTKLEVRFQDGGRLYSHLLGSLRTRFLTADLSSRLQPVDRPPQGGDVPGIAVGGQDRSFGFGQPWGAPRDSAALAARQELVDWAKSSLAASAAARAILAPGELASGEAAGPRVTGAANIELGMYSIPPPLRPLTELAEDEESAAYAVAPGWPTDNWLSNPGNTMPSTYPNPGDATFGADRSNEVGLGYRAEAGPYPAPPSSWPGGDGMASTGWDIPRGRPSALQVHNCYLVMESEEGVIVFDQHALHERILYEQFRAKALSGGVEAQELLVPEPVDLPAAEAAAVIAQREVLGSLGVRVEAFGGDTVLVHSYPARLRSARPAELLRDLASRLIEGNRLERRDLLLDDLLNMMACKAAVKSGDRLTPEEIDSLLAQRHLANDSHHCPHGRPTALVFTRDELDRQFKRV